MKRWWLTPLCPAGHLPHKGGDRPVAMSHAHSHHCRVSKGQLNLVVSRSRWNRADAPTDLPPCGGDARQGRGGYLAPASAT